MLVVRTSEPWLPTPTHPAASEACAGSSQVQEASKHLLSRRLSSGHGLLQGLCFALCNAWNRCPLVEPSRPGQPLLSYMICHPHWPDQPDHLFNLSSFSWGQTFLQYSRPFSLTPALIPYSTAAFKTDLNMCSLPSSMWPPSREVKPSQGKLRQQQ